MASDTSTDEKGQVESYEPHSGDPVSYRRRPPGIGNPAPAGLFAFASTTFLLSMYTVHTRGVHTPNVLLGMAVFTGGLVQLLAGIWELPRGNVYGATTFLLYGTFWLSYSLIYIPGSGVVGAYSDPAEFHNAFGIYLMTWLMITLMFILPVIRKHLAFTVLLSILSVTFLLLAIGEFSASAQVSKAGGVFGVITGLVAYYIAVSELMAAEPTAFMRLPLGIRAR